MNQVSRCVDVDMTLYSSIDVTRLVPTMKITNVLLQAMITSLDQLTSFICSIELTKLRQLIPTLDMALEDNKIQDFKWVLHSFWNRENRLGDAVKLQGWFGVFLGILLCGISLFAFSSLPDLKDREEKHKTAFYGLGGIYLGVGLAHIIFNIVLLVRIGENFNGEKEDREIYKLIRTASLVWAVLDLPFFSLLAVLGIRRSNKKFVKVYILLRLAASIVIVLGMIFYLVNSSTFHHLPVLGLAAAGLLGLLKYHLNLYVLHLNMMDTAQPSAKTTETK